MAEIINASERFAEIGRKTPTEGKEGTKVIEGKTPTEGKEGTTERKKGIIIGEIIPPFKRETDPYGLGENIRRQRKIDLSWVENRGGAFFRGTPEPNKPPPPIGTLFPLDLRRGLPEESR